MAVLAVDVGRHADSVTKRVPLDEPPVGRLFVAGALLLCSLTFGVVALKSSVELLAIDFAAWGFALTFAAVFVGFSGCLVTLRRRSLADRQPFVRVAAVCTALLLAAWLPMHLLRSQFDPRLAVRAAEASLLVGLTAIAVLLTLLVRSGKRNSRTIVGIGLSVSAALFVWGEGGSLPVVQAEHVDSASRAIVIMLAASLMLAGQRQARWFLAFAGLSLVGHTLAVSINAGLFGAVGNDSNYDAFAAGLLALASSCILLVGVIVELERDDKHTRGQLLAAWTHVRAGAEREARERTRHDEVLHDLRSGLLGIESVSPLLTGAPDQELVALLRTEVARLRGLTRADDRTRVFDVHAELKPTIDLHLRQGVPVTSMGGGSALADPGDFLEIMHNLIENACRHGRGTPISVAIAQSRDVVVIQVGDRGPGAPSELIERMFDAGVSTHPAGSGFGLSSARGLAVANGGDLTYARRFGGGAMFSLRLPSGHSAGDDKIAFNS